MARLAKQVKQYKPRCIRGSTQHCTFSKLSLSPRSSLSTHTHTHTHICNIYRYIGIYIASRAISPHCNIYPCQGRLFPDPMHAAGATQHSEGKKRYRSYESFRRLFYISSSDVKKKAKSWKTRGVGDQKNIEIKMDSTPRCSRVVPHPSTKRAQGSLTSVFG